jgi:hypothetical protein
MSMTKKEDMPRRKYKVSVEFADLEVIVTARTEGEARDVVRRRIRKGTLRPTLWPAKWSGTGENPTVERLSEWE